MSVQRIISLWATLGISVLLTLGSLWQPFAFVAPWTPAFLVSALALLAAYALARSSAPKGSVLVSLLWFGLFAGLGLRALVILTAAGPPESLGLDLFAGFALIEGINPYAFTANELLGGGLRVGDAALEDARAIVAATPEATAWLSAFAAVDATTDTPLLALPLLALSQFLTPGSSLSWYLILLASDTLALALLLLLMRRVRRAPGWVLLFWLNPIWLISAFSLGSAFILVAPLIALVLWASVSERSAITGFLLALSAAFNLWLAALLPLLLRSAGRRPLAWRRSAYGLVGFVLLGTVLWLVHLMFGAHLHWFGGLTASGEAAGIGFGTLFFLTDPGPFSALARFDTLIWLALLTLAGMALAWPPLPDQAQRTIRAGGLGFVLFFLTSALQPPALLALVVLLPLARSPGLVLASGFGATVALIAPLMPTTMGLDPKLIARLGVGVVIAILFIVAWIASARRNEPLE